MFDQFHCSLRLTKRVPTFHRGEKRVCACIHTHTHTHTHTGAGRTRPDEPRGAYGAALHPVRNLGGQSSTLRLGCAGRYRTRTYNRAGVRAQTRKRKRTHACTHTHTRTRTRARSFTYARAYTMAHARTQSHTPTRSVQRVTELSAVRRPVLGGKVWAKGGRGMAGREGGWD